MFKLVIQDDEGKTTVVPLIRDEITIGRKEGNTIRLTERNVSRRHARIVRNNGEVSIEDLGSYNGIRVNNARIAERVALRVSDQVQIGDYKLYLKAEGVEQVDDARTMPIERVDAQGNAPTDVIPAVPAAPTAPIAVPNVPTPVPGQLPANTKLVGSQNHTLVAVPETDAQGRPVASQAAISALTAPAAYGRLVVLSSNFAGKEFELSRPQMIVGRTDENDLVINHRSISRNHAKIVREPETGRYTISDLQSSNGVRVNGQDYGKVELRRGDVVDLGHVRLRFIEPGEDFLFSRDAVITDVPETSGRKGLLVAVVLGVLVLVGVTVVWMAKGSGSGGEGGDDQIDNRAKNGLNERDAGPDKVAILAEAGPHPAVAADAAPADDKGEKIRVDCLTHQTNREWTDLADCAQRLAKYDRSQSDEFSKIAGSESRAEAAQRHLRDALRDKEFATARKHLAEIPEDSTYYADSKELYDEAARRSAIAELRALTRNCNRFNDRARDLEAKLGKDAVAAARDRVKCVVVADNPPPPRQRTCPGDFKCGAGERCDGGRCVKDRPTPNPCDPKLVAQKEAEGRAAFSSGNHLGALAAFQSILQCKPSLLLFTYTAACRGRNFNVAKQLFRRIPAAKQNFYKQTCLQEGVDPSN